MCDILACLNREAKTRKGLYLFTPCMKLVIAGQAIEASIDLDGGKVLGIVSKVIVSWKIRWIESPHPMRVDPAGCANPNHS